MEKREYVLIVDSPELTDAHTELLKVVKAASNDDFINLFTRFGPKRDIGHGKEAQPFVSVYLFTSALRPDQIHIPGATSDRHVLLQLGESAWFEGYSRARAWFDALRRR